MTAPNAPLWPKAPGRAPVAREIAKALVVAVAETGEQETLQAILDKPELAKPAIMRAKRLTIEALHVLYPGCSMAALGGVLGVAVSGRWITAKPGWWTQGAVDRVIAGI